MGLVDLDFDETVGGTEQEGVLVKCHQVSVLIAALHLLLQLQLALQLGEQTSFDAELVITVQLDVQLVITTFRNQVHRTVHFTTLVT